MTDPVNALVTFLPILGVVDRDVFAQRFPGVTIDSESYDIPHGELVDRTERPDEFAGPEDLTPLNARRSLPPT